MLAASLSATSGWAQPFPSRPVTFVVPFAPGGPTDVLARLLSEPMKAALGQPVIVENVSGAGGTIGMARVARGPADGHSISIGNWGSHVASAAVYPVQFDVLADLEPVAQIASIPIWLVSRSSIPATNLKELVAWLKANPDQATAAIVGNGTATHLCGIHLMNETGVRLQFVTYRGAAPAMQDIVAGQVALMFGEISNGLPHMRAGTIKAHAVLAKTRSKVAPDVPTIDEAGVPGLHVALWHGTWARNGTPEPVVATLNAAIRSALADPTVRERFAAIGQETVPDAAQTPHGLGAIHKAEIDHWWPIIRAAKVTAQ